MALREELELDIDQALSDVERVGADLTQVAQTFKVDLADAISVLEASATIDVHADTTQVAPEVNEALAETEGVIDVGVNIDAGDAQQELDEVAAGFQQDDISFEVQTNVDPAVEPLQEFNETADETSQSAVDVSNAIGGITEGANVANAGLQGVAGTLSRLPVVGAAVAASLVTVGAATDGFFDSAVNATAATQRFEETFGALAAEVNQIDVGDLNTSLGDLALSLGSSASQVRNALSTFAQLGQASGASADDIAETAEQVAALSARAVALNPSLGSVGDVSERISTALARGGRFAGRFGIALSTAEIEARALADTGKLTASQLTVYERSAAGAALATEKLGDTLSEDIAKGTENPIIALRALQAEFKKATTEIGKPLISPMFDLLEAAQPIAIEFAQILGDIAVTALPALTNLLNGLQPVITVLSESFAEALDAIEPALARIGTALGEIFQGFIPVIEIATTILVEGFAPVLEFIASALENRFVQAVLLAVGAFKLLSTTLIFLSAHPLVAFLTAISAVVAAFNLLGDQDPGAAFEQFGRDVDAAAKTVNTALFGSAGTVDDLREAVAAAEPVFGKFISTQSEFADDPAALDGLRKMSIGVDDLRGQLTSGQQGLEDFTEAFAKSGQIKVKIDGVEQTVDSFDDLTESQKKFVTENSATLQAFSRQQAAIEQASQAKINELVLTEQVTEQQVLLAQGIDRAQNGYTSYAQQLEILTNEILPAAVASQAGLTNSAALQQAGFEALAGAVLSGSVTTENFAITTEGLADRLNVSAEAIGGFVEFISAKVAEVAQSISANLPTAADAFTALDEAAGPQDLANQLALRTLAIAQFTENLRFIMSQGGADLAAELARQGPEAAGALAESFATGAPSVITETERLVDGVTEAADGLSTFITDELAPTVVGQDIPKLTREATEALGIGLDLKGAAAGPAQELSAFLSDNEQIRSGASFGGEQAAQSFGDGFGTGLDNISPDVQQAMRDLVDDALGAGRDQAQADSPSKVFAALGEDMGAGIAVGLSDVTPAVVQAAEQVVRDAAASVASIGVPLNATIAAAPVSPTVVNLTVSTLNVEVQGGADVSDQELERQGQVAAKAVEEQLSATAAQVIARGL